MARLARSRKVFEELIDQGRDVLAPLAQRGQVDREDVQPVIEIPAKAAGVYVVFEVGIGGGEHAYVDSPRRGGAHSPDLTLLEHP